MRKLLIIVLAFLLLTAGVLVFVPWRTVLEDQIISALEERGFPDVSLQVSGLSPNSIIIDKITFGAQSPVTLDNVKIDYSFAGLRNRQLEKLTISAPSFVVRQVEGRWVIVNFEKMNANARAKPISVTSLTETLNKVPFNEIIIEKGSMNIEAESWTLMLPLDITFDKRQSRLSYKAEAAHLRKGTIEASIEKVAADIHFDKDTQGWKGQWQADPVNVKGMATDMPPLKGQGNIAAKETSFSINGALRSSDNTYQAAFRYDHSFDSAVNSVLALSSAKMPWKEGNLKLKDVNFPVGVEQAVHLNVQVENVSVDELLGAMTKQKVAGTGTVSGSIPVTIHKNGDLSFGQGKLTAAGPGSINMPPDSIPGDNEQMALVRDILANLNYTALSISMNNDNQNKLGVSLNVEGNNPDVYNGRAVKLNVNLTGDVLDFIQQNVILLTKPQSLWEEDANE